jgi:hypothetical protein
MLVSIHRWTHAAIEWPPGYKVPNCPIRYVTEFVSSKRSQDTKQYVHMMAIAPRSRYGLRERGKQ